MEQINWIVVVGKAEVGEKGKQIRYESGKFINQLGQEEIIQAIVKSNVEFDNGEISFKLRSKNQYGSCQIFFNYDNGSRIAVGLNVSIGLYGIAKYANEKNSWDSLSLVGLPETFQINQEYAFTIKIEGSIIELYVNDILVSTAYERINKSQIAFFFSSPDEITVEHIEIKPKKSKAFIVMQFTDEYNHLYSDVIKPVAESFGFECERADEMHTTNSILQDVIQSIRESSVIIADITPDNPNVFYEIGYAHAVNKATILLCDRKRDKLPFDISGFRTLFYDNTIAGKTAVEQSLTKYLSSINSRQATVFN
jgi:hypothetical protein